MKIFKLSVVLIVFCLILVYGFIQSGIFNVAAVAEDGPLLAWLLHSTMENSVEKHAAGIEVPDLTAREMIIDGVSDYVGMCGQCHGEPGSPPSPVRQGLNPTPPDLGDLAQEATPAQMYWVISNGIRMSGMPAFGKTHDPEEIWPVVAFLQSARNISAADYAKLKMEGRGHGHHGGAMEEEDHDSHHHGSAGAGESPEHVEMNHHHEQDGLEQNPPAGSEGGKKEVDEHTHEHVH